MQEMQRKKTFDDPSSSMFPVKYAPDINTVVPLSALKVNVFPDWPSRPPKKERLLLVKLKVTFPTNPPASGTTYQNSNDVAVTLYVPITFAASTASTVEIAIGPRSGDLTTLIDDSEPDTTGARTKTYTVRVPAGWSFSVTVSGTGASIGTVIVTP